jgi:hypothetical protein
MLVSCFAYSSTLKIEATFPLRSRLTFNELHGIISQKIEIFIATALRPPNPALQRNV